MMIYLICHRAIQGTAVGMVLSSQISNGFIELPENSTVMLRFSNVSIKVYFKTLLHVHISP